MPFGPSCEFDSFADCVKKYKGKKSDPEAYCGKIKAETEDHCKKRALERARGDSSPAHRRWQYDVESHSFIDTDSGRKLSDARMNELLDDFLSTQLQRVQSLTDELTGGYSTITEWEVDMRRVVKESYGVSYLLGRGGRTMMDFHDWGRVGRAVRDQYLWLNQFAREIAAGNISGEKAQQRAALYVGSARQSFGKARGTAYGDVPLPAYPGDGSTACLGHCACRWDIAERKEGGWEATWVLGETDHCADCERRSADWAPLILGGPTHQ